MKQFKFKFEFSICYQSQLSHSFRNMSSPPSSVHMDNDVDEQLRHPDFVAHLTAARTTPAGNRATEHLRAPHSVGTR